MDKLEIIALGAFIAALNAFGLRFIDRGADVAQIQWQGFKTAIYIYATFLSILALGFIVGIVSEKIQKSKEHFWRGEE